MKRAKVSKVNMKFKLICLFLLFYIMIFGYNIMQTESKFHILLFSFLFATSIMLFLLFNFYEKNLNYIFTYKNGKLIVHTLFNIYTFDINNTYIKTGGKGINSYFYILEPFTNKKVKFNCLFFGTKRFEMLKKQLTDTVPL